MKIITYMVLFMVLNVAVAGLSSSVNAGQGKNSSASNMSKKSSSNSNTQWSADPERGWVRADERRKSSDSGKVPVGAGQNNGKQKSKGKANKS